MRVRAKVGYSNKDDNEVYLHGMTVLEKMSGSRYFLKPPVTMENLKAELERYSKANANALNRGRQDFVAQRAQRAVVVVMLRSLGHYAEDNCNNDMEIFLTSGFQAKGTTRVPSKPLGQSAILKISQGLTGQLVLKIKAVLKTLRYELEYAARGTNGELGPWTLEEFSGVRGVIRIGNLQPGTVYTFRVRPYGVLGYAPWSEPVSRMCT